jgi:hypothetical protein
MTRARLLICTSLLSMLVVGAAQAAENYQSGHISNITFVADTVFIQLDSGLPTNCTGTPHGWMTIPTANKAMIAFVTGLYLRGDMASVAVTVYTSGIGSSGYCQITQIDPAE